jgi:hypothetical protein
MKVSRSLTYPQKHYRSLVNKLRTTGVLISRKPKHQLPILTHTHTKWRIQEHRYNIHLLNISSILHRKWQLKKEKERSVRTMTKILKLWSYSITFVQPLQPHESNLCDHNLAQKMAFKKRKEDLCGQWQNYSNYGLTGLHLCNQCNHVRVIPVTVIFS